jgi:DNA (cytosine-5)-methyltransferase 1
VNIAGNINPSSSGMNGNVFSTDGVEPTITTNKGEGNKILEPKTNIDFKIRKLTPHECFRLMDIPEENINELLDSGISNSQLYKLAGNSIVVNCLYHIFRKLFVEKENDNKQLEIF